ncbi:MAG: HD domain-containing protein [Peptococcaceae bacterium]|nr:HD domain-containing protein [Peptococcaceae bacterium]
MARVAVADLKNGMRLASSFVVKSKRLTPYKGKPGNFLSLILGDSSGQVEAKIWERGDEANSAINAGDVLEIKGEVREFNGSLQVYIGSYRVCRESEFDPREFLPVAPGDTKQMLNELKGMIDSVENAHLRALLFDFFNDGEWRERFCTVPAAKANHQAYLGGLLEHTLNVARAAAAAVRLYPRLDRDLLLAGAILHDIGKVEEYRCDRLIDFTDQGRLLGHIVMGVSEVDRRIRQLEGDPFPENLRIKILHIITSHHGLYEWQSPKRPKFMEAAVIHILDMLDTVVDAFARAADENTGENSSWSPWIRSLERYVFLK